MYRVFCVALEYITKDRMFLTFGKNASINDVMEVIMEESHDQMTRVLGMSLIESTSKKGLQKSISEWKKHFDA